MSRTRRSTPAEKDPEDRFEIRTLALNYPRGNRIDSHRHDWHQLISASRGVMTVNTANGSWVVPSHRAVWVPAGTEHNIQMFGTTHVRTLYIRGGLSRLLPMDCCVVN